MERWTSEGGRRPAGAEKPLSGGKSSKRGRRCLSLNMMSLLQLCTRRAVGMQIQPDEWIRALLKGTGRRRQPLED